jgi:hypothetical protein
MSILADSLGPSYPLGASPSLQEDAPLPTEKPPTVHRDEALLSDNPADGSLDFLSGLVDFELFEQAMQSPEDDTSRNNQAPADLDANVLLSSYQQLLDAQTLSTPPPFRPVF